MACQICRSLIVSSKIRINDYEYNPSHFAEYNVCKNCTVIYRNKIKLNEANKLYNQNYLPVSGGTIYDFLKKLNALYEWKAIRRIKNELETNIKIKFLDIACGKGFLIKKISKKHPFECIGIDINQTKKKRPT